MRDGALLKHVAKLHRRTLLNLPGAPIEDDTILAHNVQAVEIAGLVTSRDVIRRCGEPTTPLPADVRTLPLRGGVIDGILRKILVDDLQHHPIIRSGAR